MAFQRRRVPQPIPSLAPGKLEGASVLHFKIDMPGVDIVYTTDGSVPIPNRAREHGFRSKVYRPTHGIQLCGRTRHTIIVGAHKVGFTSPPLLQLVYDVGGKGDAAPSHLRSGGGATRRPASRATAEVARIQAEFASSMQHDAYTSVDAVSWRHQGQPLKCVLADSEGGTTAYRRAATPSFGLRSRTPTPLLGRGQRTKDRVMSSLLDLDGVEEEAQADVSAVAEASQLEHAHGPLVVFRVDTDPRVASRNHVFKRVFVPNMGLKVPVVPSTALIEQQPSSLRSHKDRRAFTPPVYERPSSMLGERRNDTVSPLPRKASMPPSGAAAGERRDRQKSVTIDGAGGGALVAPNDVSPIRGDDPHHGQRSRTPSIAGTLASNSVMRPGSRSKSLMSRTQLFWFEKHANLVPNEGETSDAEEEQETKQYNNHGTQLMVDEQKRVGPHSTTFTREFTKTLPTRSSDVAINDKTMVRAFHVAREISRSAISKVLTMVPLSDIVKDLSHRRHFSAGDLYHAIHHKMSTVELGDALKPLPADNRDNPAYDTAFFITVCRYVLWTARREPEAAIAFSLMIWSSEYGSSMAISHISKLDFLTLIEVYRRAPGASPAAVAALQTAFYAGIEWAPDGRVAASVASAHLAEMEPLWLGQKAKELIDTPLHEEPCIPHSLTM